MAGRNFRERSTAGFKDRNGILGPPVVPTASHIVSVPLGAYSATLNETRTILALP